MNFAKKSIFILIVLVIALSIIGYFSTKYLPPLFVIMVVAILVIALVFRFLKDKKKILK